MKRNKKRGTQKREREIVNCCNKLKKDYINYYDYADLFYYEYELINNQCKENLKKISRKLVEVEIAKGDN